MRQLLIGMNVVYTSILDQFIENGIPLMDQFDDLYTILRLLRESKITEANYRILEDFSTAYQNTINITLISGVRALCDAARSQPQPLRAHIAFAAIEHACNLYNMLLNEDDSHQSMEIIKNTIALHSRRRRS